MAVASGASVLITIIMIAVILLVFIVIVALVGLLIFYFVRKSGRE